ncbi:MAG: hypothetical protein ACI9TK_001110 [Flavobacteriaceae bacterium]
MIINNVVIDYILKKTKIKTIDLHLIRHKEAMEKVKEALNEEKSIGAVLR